MSGFSPATPFGARAASLGHLATAHRVRTAARAVAGEGANSAATVNKWAVFRSLAAAARPLGLADRTLALLNALLSFHPETAMTLPAPDAVATAADLVVYPSNRALSARAHGMAEKTMRRHLAALVEAGLILRRDSPNGKRYARRGDGAQENGAQKSGAAEMAFGFDLSPLVARAGEFEALAEAERLRLRQVARLREMVSLLRRDVLKLVALGLETGRAGPWEDYRLALMGLMVPLRRLGEDTARLDALRTALEALRTDVLACLAIHENDTEMTGNAGETDRHHTNSNPDARKEPEPAVETDRGEAAAPPPGGGEERTGQESALPLALVLEACPDLAAYAGGGTIAGWRDFDATVRLIRPMLGISGDAWREAVAVLGERAALITVASILQRSEHSSEAVTTGQGITVNGSPAIRSAGGYLRALTERARAGAFSLGPVVMALTGQRLKARRAAR